MRLVGKVALITGGASGLGAATVRRFVDEGAEVVIGDVRDADAQALAAELGGTRCVATRLDVSREGDWQAAVAATLARFGRLDILVNNAGLSGFGYDDTTDPEVWRRLVDTNATGALLGIRQVVPVMRAAGGGAIVNLSSISGVVGQPGIHMGYSASKGAIRALTKVAAVQYGPDNIRVNSVHPGMMPPMRRLVDTPVDPAARERSLARVPLGRPGEAVEAANAVLFLASDEASYVTGAELYVDGGYLAR